MIGLLDKALVIQCYCQPVKATEVENQAALRRLIDHSLARINDGLVEVIERGRIYCEALRDFPLPVQRWVIPSPVTQPDQS